MTASGQVAVTRTPLLAVGTQSAAPAPSVRGEKSSFEQLDVVLDKSVAIELTSFCPPSHRRLRAWKIIGRCLVRPFRSWPVLCGRADSTLVCVPFDPADARAAVAGSESGHRPGEEGDPTVRCLHPQRAKAKRLDVDLERTGTQCQVRGGH